MKKIFCIILMLLMLIPSAFILSACDEEHTHSFPDTYEYDDNDHWRKCDGCDEVKDKAGHDFNEGTVTTPATTTADGVKTFTCKICGKTKTESFAYSVRTSVSNEEEWKSALNLSLRDNVAIYMTSGDDETDVKYDGSIVYTYMDFGTTVMKYYVGKIGDKYYEYNCYNGEWRIQEMTDEKYNKSLGNLLDFSAQFTWESFGNSYNAGTGRYEIASININNSNVTDVSIRIEDGKFIEATMKQDGVESKYTVSYGNVTALSMPKRTMASEEEWNRALNLLGHECITATKCGRDGEKIVTKRNGSTIYFEIRKSSGELDSKYYISKENNRRCSFYDGDAEWRVSTISDNTAEIDLMFEQQLIQNGIANNTKYFKYSDFKDAYKEETGSYEFASYKVGNYTLKNVKMTFMDGTLIHISYDTDSNDYPYDCTYSYARIGDIKDPTEQ